MSSPSSDVAAVLRLGYLFRAHPSFMTTSLTPCRNDMAGQRSKCGGQNQISVTVRQLRVCRREAPSLTRGRLCRLQLLLVLASAIILGSESRGTYDHILLSQIQHSPKTGHSYFTTGSLHLNQFVMATSPLRITTSIFFSTELLRP
jgi:hypothetical protein